MNSKPRLIHIQNHFQAGAIPYIIRDVQSQIGRLFDVHIVVLQGITNDPELVDELEASGISVHVLKCKRWNLLLAGVRLRYFLTEIKPAIVHAHAGRGSILAPLCTPRHVPVVVTYHSVRSGYNVFTRRVRTLTDRRAAARTAVSKAAAQSWRAFRVGKVETVYNPVCSERYEVPNGEIARIRQEFDVGASIPLIVNVGRLSRAKNQDALLQAMAVAQQAGCKPFRLVIAGRGPQESALKQQAKELGIAESVIFAGFRKDIPALVAAADVFAFPSRWEGLGIAALEAMAAGTAVVASDLDVIREYISDGETGLLTPPEDVQELSRKIQLLIKDTDLRNRVAEAGRGRVCEMFSAERIANQYLALYQSLSLAGPSMPKYDGKQDGR